MYLVALVAFSLVDWHMELTGYDYFLTAAACVVMAPFLYWIYRGFRYHTEQVIIGLIVGAFLSAVVYFGGVAGVVTVFILTFGAQLIHKKITGRWFE